MTGSYSCIMLSLNSTSEGKGGEAGGGGSRQALPQVTSDKRGFCWQDYWGQSAKQQQQGADRFRALG